ncbi:MAG: hypothetical protein VCC99_04550 [Alphaproteobacteria bacterium]
MSMTSEMAAPGVPDDSYANTVVGDTAANSIVSAATAPTTLATRRRWATEM